MSPGAVIRAQGVELTCGGKGINVARALRALGSQAFLVLPVGTRDRARYEQLLAAENLAAEILPVTGGVRTATILLESETERVTVINESGEFEEPAQWREVIGRVLDTVHAGDLILVMGSLPSGLAPDALVDRLLQALIRPTGCDVFPTATVVDRTDGPGSVAFTVAARSGCDENLGADYQLSVVQDADGSWRVDRALRRGLCGRGASGDVCV